MRVVWKKIDGEETTSFPGNYRLLASLGPLHHGKEELKAMEEHDIRSALLLYRRWGVSDAKE
uniref:Uncharacterized protein n=1 Tax=Salix viminalis TaxID=40686 RepID=A0A6N2LPG0_SALVM